MRCFPFLFSACFSVLVFSFVFLPDESSSLASDSSVIGKIDLAAGSICDGRIGSCLPSDVDTESSLGNNQRILLTQRKYISYETLKRDMVPCNEPGASYYTCRARSVNSYGRVCETITLCGRNIRDINN